MMSELRDPARASPIDGPQQPRKKRKLRHPRASRACAFCRRRKIRCTGETPTCTACKEEDIECRYEPTTRGPEDASPAAAAEANDTVVALVAPEVNNPASPPHAGLVPSSRNSRRNSLDASATFDHGLHIGSNSGVSFLYRWQEGSGQNGIIAADTQVPLACYGDPMPVRVATQPYPSAEEGKILLDHYFRFAAPTFRFLHKPSVEDWMQNLLHSKPLSSAKAACVLLVWSQALLTTSISDMVSAIEKRRPLAGPSYCDQAMRLLEAEPGPVTLASVQARTALILYLLSTSRVNECRFISGITTTLVTALGLHRRYATKRLKLDAIEAEGCKRAFWSVYVIDGYLSVILGRPRSFQDKDIDQEYPYNIDDKVLEATADPKLVPHHGNLEASIFHAKLARVMAQNTDNLYPLRSLTEREIVDYTRESLSLLQEVENSLPPFLKPRDAIMVGSSIWERQNTVLKLALAHARVLATRRCILTDDAGYTAAATTDNELKDRRSAFIQICIHSIITIIDVTYELMQKNRLYGAFWYTQYISLCAISTLFMYKIQCSRSPFLAQVSRSLTRTNATFEKAEEVQQYLARIAQPGSQAQRHHDLLRHLRNRANNRRTQAQTRPSALPRVQVDQITRPERIGSAADGMNAQAQHVQEAVGSSWDGSTMTAMPFGQEDGSDAHLQTEFTPTSSTDFNLYQDSMPWQYLDQLGTFGGEQTGWFYQMP
ncbi:fungal-specific transcription factor domain-containing protein [Xylariales sp. PMI_506]|nr:fungal-specific transcription factor domain-containing protein [Xylariales sp. PMI_506]